MRHRAHYIAILILCAISCTAQPDPDPTSWFRDITVPPGQTLNGATCFFCSIHVDGELKHDATTQWGDIDIHGVVGGDAVAVAGSIHLYPSARVQGDSVSVFGDNRLDDRSQVAGDVVASWGSIKRFPTALAARSESANGQAFLSKIPPRWRTALILWLIGLCLSSARVSLLLDSRSSATGENGRTSSSAAIEDSSVWRTDPGGLNHCNGSGEHFKAGIARTRVIGIAATTACARIRGDVSVDRSAIHCFSGESLADRRGCNITVQIIPILGWIMALVMMVLSLGILAMAVAGHWKTTA